MKNLMLIIVVFLISRSGIAQINEKIVEEKSPICIFPYINHKAEFPGGIQNLRKIITSKIGRRALAGKTFEFEFTIANDGRTKSIKISDEKKYFKDRHIAKLIESLPKWKPEIQQDKLIESKIIAQITF